MRSSANDLIPTRYSLLSRLEDWSDQESWKVFFDTYWRLIYSMALKSGLTEDEAQDVVQETVIAVARDIRKFERDRTLGSFKGWLRNIVRWRIADQFRKRLSMPRADGLEPRADELAEIPDPAGSKLEVLWQEEWQANLFSAAVDRVKQRVKGEHYQIFDFYVLQGWPAVKVARTMRVNVGRVYLIKHRISSLIKKEIQALEKKSF
jgi:RNA polymerase sigma factor (sigma-70 family)